MVPIELPVMEATMRTKRKGRSRLVLTSFFIEPAVFPKYAATHADLSLGQPLRRDAQMWLAGHTRQQAVASLDASPVNANWIHSKPKKGGRS
jgi:hypothetical protein